ncbi:serum opacification factor [Streptococcus dysgalactiae]|uniref:serum opacification factor n=2 Tax=Bacteria TaxID=2 RepID=UPI002DD44F7A|nr:serum opacification factor [Streptococcus dysgalactiae]MEC4578274.1 serum opacification factor [Streptococcus dysgalactiae]
MTTTVMGEEVTQPTATEVTALSVTVEVPSEEVPTTTEVQSDPKSIAENKGAEEKQAFEAPTASQGEDSSLQPKSRSKRSAEPQLMEVERIEVDKENSSLTVKDGEEEKQLIKHRDGNQRDIFDIKRDVVADPDGTSLNVTLTVSPKQIDEGAEVIVLLDTSKKMTEEDFNTAKENIKKLVATLTSKSTNDSPNYNSRNSVRLIDFYRKIGDSIDLSGWEESKVDEKLQEVRKKAQEDYNGWGVNLQGAIHKAREIFNSEKEKNSGKRQHIVLFSQGEATFSYDIKEKSKKNTKRIMENVESSNPLLPWPPVFSFTNQNRDMIQDAQFFIDLGKKLGISDLDSTHEQLKSAGTLSGWGGALLGNGSLTEYLTLKEYITNKLTEQQFDYGNRIGDGYHHYSFSARETSGIPFKEIIKTKLDNLFNVDKTTWFGWILDKTSLSDTYKQTKQKALLKVLEYLFYKREYIYYNHNLSAQAEAKMARDEGIVFYSFDVTNPKQITKETQRKPSYPYYNEYLKKKAEEDKKITEARNTKFDKYLKEMSDGHDFLKQIEDKDKFKDKFKDILEEIKLTETFEKYVNVQDNSWKTSPKESEDNNKSVAYTKPSNGKLWSLLSTPESLTWSISKEQLQNAFKSGTPLTLDYKLKINSTEFKTHLGKRRKKRSTASAEQPKSESVTEKIISNKISYKINGKTANGQNLEDVNVTYSKEKVPVPEIDGEVIKPQAPQLPKLPPVIEHGPDLDFTEDTIYRLPLEHGHYKPNTNVTFTEDTKPEKTDTIIGGNVIDLTEDSIPDKQYTESGHNPTNESQEIIEDTKPGTSNKVTTGGQSNPIDTTKDTQPGLSGQMDSEPIIEDTKAPDIIIGGQDDMVTITQDTQPGLSGQANNLVITEDTRKPELTISGQSESVEITEDTQPVLSGSNDGAVVEEDTRPKLQFHFDNEEPTPTINQVVTQTSVAKVDDKLPQTGDNDKLEAFFTITALTVIGTAGLLAKKRREDPID